MTEERAQESQNSTESALSLGVWARIREHKVAQWTLAYAAAALALLEGTKLVSEAFDWPHLVLRLVTVLLFLGLPLVVTLAWYHGHRALRNVSGPELTVITILLVLAGGVLWHFARSSRESAAPTITVTTSAVATFSPPPHSIAVLPFVNLSGDKEQEYFSEGLTEEVLNSLARLDELHVAARTSSFSFQGEHPDIAAVAHKLNVAAVLEGSVRREGHTVRITTQLVNGVTGFHMWSETYDRDLKDMLKLQTEIANAVASALKVTLLGDVAARIEVGGTRNPTAFDAYLRASKAAQLMLDGRDVPGVAAAYSEAIRLDPNFALAFAGRSLTFTVLAAEWSVGTAIRENFVKAEADARRAIALAPELAEAHAALAYVSMYGTLDFRLAQKEYERAVALAPGNALVLRVFSEFTVKMGHFDDAIASAHRAVVLDPLNADSYTELGYVFLVARRYVQAVTAYEDGISVNPERKDAYGFRGLAFYGLGDLDHARASCETYRDYWVSRKCLAMVYSKLGRQADGVAEIDNLKAAYGDTGAYEYATIYAQWGDRAMALKWLDTAVSRRDSGLSNLKTDRLMDPLRNEPRFQAVLRELRFPD
jgi:TolB-like protein/Flp pilus assembly protein TadD